MTDNKMQSYTDINAPYSIGFSKGQRIVLLLFSFFYLWLMSGLSYSVSINAFYDDTLQMQEGLAISQGQWLVGENIKGFASGEEWWKMNHYSHATLVKAPGFPILIALSFWTGIPLLFTMPLLWVSACLLFIHGLRPFLVRRWPLVVVFGLLLFNPMQYDASILRVYREAWNNCILLFVIAAAVGFWARVRGGGGLVAVVSATWSVSRRFLDIQGRGGVDCAFSRCRRYSGCYNTLAFQEKFRFSA